MLVGCTLLRAKTILLMIFEIQEKVLIVIQTEEYTDKICELYFIGRVLKTEWNEVISWANHHASFNDLMWNCPIILRNIVLETISSF